MPDEVFETRNYKRVPVLFLDIDGTVRKGFDELGRFVNTPEDVELFPRMAQRLLSYKQRGWRIAGISNQGGIATGEVTYEQVLAAMRRTQELSQNAFDVILICRHHPNAHDPELRNCYCRKPKMGALVMAVAAISNRVDPPGQASGQSFEIYPPDLALMVGDRPEDEQCAKNAGVQFMWAKNWRALPFSISIGEERPGPDYEIQGKEF